MEHRAYNQRSEIRSQRSESTILILFLKSEIRNHLVAANWLRRHEVTTLRCHLS